MSQAMINSIAVSVIGTLLGVIATAFWKSREAVIKKAEDLAKERVADRVRISELETKLALVSQQVVPISTAFQAILIKELTHFHTPEMDGLMAKIGPPNTLTPVEEDRLAVLLKERSENMGPEIPESERDAALILPSIVKRAREESEIQDKVNQIHWGFVTVPERRQRMDMAEAIKPADPTASEQSITESLESIDKNTAATADSLAILNQRATDKLSAVAARKGLDAERETNPVMAKKNDER